MSEETARVRILMVGDVVGRPGRLALSRHLGRLKESLAPDITIVNGENAAGGFGLTRKVADELFSAGADVLTTGNHIWDRKEAAVLLDDERILRPANYPPGTPGTGYCLIPVGESLLFLMNLSGRVFMNELDCPFRTVDQLLEAHADRTKIRFLDFHAEATSEKSAMGWYLDSRVSAVVGTHTHVQTADERILPGGTAFITDVGMTGPVNSVIGMNKDIVIEKFVTALPVKFEVASGLVRIDAVVVDIEPATGRAISIKRICEYDPKKEELTGEKII